MGIIKKTYTGCKKFIAGDKVCLTWVKSQETIGKSYVYKDINNRNINSGPVHTLNEYAVIDESRMYKLNDPRKIKNKVLLGCAIPTIFNIFLENKIKKNASICVLGGGGLGTSFILIAKSYGFKKISLLDNNKKKLNLLRKKFKIITYNSIQQVPHENFDLVIECTGNISIFEHSIKLAKKFGGKVIIVGNYKKKINSKLDPWHIIEGKTLKGAWNKNINFKNNFLKMERFFNELETDFYFSGKIYKLNDINKAIADLKKGKVIRPLIKMV